MTYQYRASASADGGHQIEHRAGSSPPFTSQWYALETCHMESGTVNGASRNGSIIKIRSASTVSTIKMLGDEGELPVGDVVRGNWTSLSGETIYRGAQAFNVLIQHFT